MRMVTDWNAQSKYFKRQLWGSLVLANVFVLVNMVLQLVPSILILARKQIKPSVVGLMTSVALQTIMYHLLWDPHAFLR